MKNSKAALGFIFITVMVDVVGMGIIIPVLPNLIAELIDGSISDASIYGGFLIFAYASMQFLFAPVLGGLSDQYGRRPVLLISLFGFGIDYIFLALAPDIWWLFIGRIISGIAGASFTTASAYIADVSPPEKKAQNFGLIGAAFGLGFIIGPAIGGVLGEYGSRVPFYAAAALTLLNWLYGYFILPESLSKENRRKFDISRANPIGSLIQLNKYPVLFGMIGTLILLYIAAHAVQSTWSYFTIERFDWSPKDVGWSLAFVGLLVAIVQGYLIRIVVPKIGENAAVYTGLIFNSVGLILFAFASEGWMIYAFLIPYVLGGLAGPSIQGIMSNQVTTNEQGELQGALTSLVAVTSIIGPPMMTTIFAYFTDVTEGQIYFPGAPMLLGAILSIISIWFVHVTFQKVQKLKHQ